MRRSRGPRSRAAPGSRSRPSRSRCNRCSRRVSCASPSTPRGPELRRRLLRARPRRGARARPRPGRALRPRRGLRPRRRLRVRQDVELGGPSAEAALAAIESVTSSLIEATDACRASGSAAWSSASPASSTREGRLSLTHFLELEGDVLGDDLAGRLGLEVTLVNDINLAALGEEWQGVARGVDDFAFLSVGTGLGMDSCSAASCTRAATAPPASSTLRCSGSAASSTPRRTGQRLRRGAAQRRRWSRR